MPLHRFASVALLLALASSCAAEGTDEAPELGMRVEWLDADAHELPTGVESIRIIVTIGEDGTPQDTTVSVANLMERSGRPFLSHPLLSDLPTGTPIRITVEGKDARDAVAFLGHVGPIVLSPGERRYVALRMYPVGNSLPFAGPSARMLATTTALPDGRVLVAGGFDQVEDVTCPEGSAADARCFDFSATREAFVFDPTTSEFHPVQGGMLAARGGHTATALPGGRVLVAGGAERMRLRLTPIDMNSFAHTIEPLRMDGAPGAHGTFEVFLSNANAEAEDLDRDGDPARGGFTGAADVAIVPGRMNHERFMHAAAAVPGASGRVLLAGGMGSTGGDATWEIFDDQRAGGYGFYDAERNELTTPRAMPGAAALTVPDGGSIWIVGGALALDDDDLAEIWTPVTGDPNGTVAAATTTEFPAAAAGETDPHPEHATLAPEVVALNGGTHALVVGWLGARCAPGTSMPMYPAMPDGSDTVPCGHGAVPGALLIDGATGLAHPQATLDTHAFAASARLDDGRVAITGGLLNITWGQQQSVDVLTGVVSGTAAITTMQRTLVARRAFHDSAELPGGGVFTFGGITVFGDPAMVSLVSGAEVLYLPR